MNWGHYLLQVNIYLVIFYGFYQLLLSTETYFILNRIYLIAAGIFSLSIPFLSADWLIGPGAQAHMTISAGQLNTLMASVTVMPEQAAGFNWASLVKAVYLSGVLFFTLRLMRRLLGVRKLLRSGKKGMAFSFFRQKVVDESLPAAGVIHAHEEAHVRQLHTLDILFFELLGIVAWLNPVIYGYKRAVKNIHEYLADEQAARFQGNKEAYSLLLLSQAFGVDPHSLIHNFFNQSLLKKRIFMLNKQRSKKTAILKYGLFLPLFGLMLVLSSATISENEEIKNVAEQLSAPIPLRLSTSPAADTGRKAAVKIVKLTGEDSWTPFYKFLSSNIRYPEAAQHQQLQGNTIIKFSLTAGQVNGISVVTPLGMGCDAQVMKAILSFADFKKAMDGKYSLKVAFRLSNSKAKTVNAALAAPTGYTALKTLTITVPAGTPAVSGSVAQNQAKVFDFVSLERQPEFPGGMNKFYEYLAQNVKYPAEAITKKVEGKVFLSFIVEQDGQLSSVKVERSLGSGTDEEAVRLLENSPRWTPGIINNEPVRVKYNLPISFTLTKSKTVEVIKILPGVTSGSPIYIVDGKKMDEASATKIVPGDIESINVLKAATATAKYGDEGKDGVIVITTKQGKQPAAVTVQQKEGAKK